MTAFTIVGEDLAWNLDQVAVPVGEVITATIENRDEGLDHNLHIRSDGDPRTELEPGPVTQTLRFTIEAPGEYDFLCDDHPIMRGVIVAR